MNCLCFLYTVICHNTKAFFHWRFWQSVHPELLNFNITMQELVSYSQTLDPSLLSSASDPLAFDK